MAISSKCYYLFLNIYSNVKIKRTIKKEEYDPVTGYILKGTDPDIIPKRKSTHRPQLYLLSKRRMVSTNQSRPVNDQFSYSSFPIST